MSLSIIAAKFPGTCRLCGKPVEAGEVVAYGVFPKGKGVAHEGCAFPPVAPKPASEADALEFVDELRQAYATQADVQITQADVQMGHR